MGIFGSKEQPKPGLVPEYAIITLETKDGFLSAVFQGNETILLFSKTSGAGSSFQVIPKQGGHVSLKSVVLGKYVTLDRTRLRLLHYKVGGSWELWKLEGTLEACSLLNQAWNTFRMDARVTVVAVPSDLMLCSGPVTKSDKGLFSAQSLLAQNYELNRTIEVLKIELQSTHAESDRRHRDLEAENGRLRADVERLMSELCALSDQVRDQELALQRTEVQVKLFDENEREAQVVLVDSVHKAAEIDRLVTLVMKAESEIECQAQRVLALQERVQQLEGELVEASSRLHEVEAQLKDQHMLEVTAEESKKEVANMEHEMAALRSKLARANNNFAITQAEVIALKRQVAELEKTPHSDANGNKPSSSKLKKLLTVSQSMKSGPVGMGSLFAVDASDRSGVLHSGRAAMYRASFDSIDSTATSVASELSMSPRGSSPASSAHASEDTIEPFVLSRTMDSTVRFLAAKYRRHSTTPLPQPPPIP